MYSNENIFVFFFLSTLLCVILQLGSVLGDKKIEVSLDV